MKIWTVAVAIFGSNYGTGKKIKIVFTFTVLGTA
jgi:hypothetical protein